MHKSCKIGYCAQNVCLCGFPLGAPASYHSQKTSRLSSYILCSVGENGGLPRLYLVICPVDAGRGHSWCGDVQNKDKLLIFRWKKDAVVNLEN